MVSLAREEDDHIVEGIHPRQQLVEARAEIYCVAHWGCDEGTREGESNRLKSSESRRAIQ